MQHRPGRQRRDGGVVFCRDDTQRYSLGASRLTSEEAQRIGKAINRIPEFRCIGWAFSSVGRALLAGPYHVALEDTYIRAQRGSVIVFSRSKILSGQIELNDRLEKDAITSAALAVVPHRRHAAPIARLPEAGPAWEPASRSAAKRSIGIPGRCGSKPRRGRICCA